MLLQGRGHVSLADTRINASIFLGVFLVAGQRCEAVFRLEPMYGY